MRRFSAPCLLSITHAVSSQISVAERNKIKGLFCFLSLSTTTTGKKKKKATTNKDQPTWTFCKGFMVGVTSADPGQEMVNVCVWPAVLSATGS